jgi:hypothetical protein
MEVPTGGAFTAGAGWGLGKMRASGAAGFAAGRSSDAQPVSSNSENGNNAMANRFMPIIMAKCACGR